MAYFPNGIAGEVLDEQCSDCPLGYGWNNPQQGSLFEIAREPRPCPVFLVQSLHNYNQISGHGCEVTADYLENLEEPPQFVERVDNVHYGSSASQLKVAIQWLRSTDFEDAMNLLVNAKGICQVREQLVQIRREQQ